MESAPGVLRNCWKAPVIVGKEGRAELVSHNMPQSQMSEAFRALRTSLLLSQAIILPRSS